MHILPKSKDPEADGGPDDKFSLAPSDPEAPPISVGRAGNLMSRRRRRENCTGWCNESCVRGRGGCASRRGRTACVDVVGIPHRRWQDRMRDKSIQCD